MLKVVAFMRQVANGLQMGGNFGTAHVYRSSLNAIIVYCGKGDFTFDKVTPGWLKGFEIHLRSRGCSWNTVSTYLRTFRTQELFTLMFLLRGLPFVDLAYLRKSDLHDNVITYRRRKTGRTLSVTLTPEAMLLVKKHMNCDPSSPYLFSLLKSREGTKEAYREYQLALRTFNRQLMLLGELLGLGDKLSSYTARHTWATTAYYCEIHPGIISEAMGHSSITVTETYLKPFQNKKIDEANKRVIDFIRYSVRNAIC